MDKKLFIDSHAHLDDPRLFEDLGGVLERATKAGVTRMVTVGCWNKRGGFDRVVELISSNANLYGALGVHPHEAKEVVDSTPYDAIREVVTSADPKLKGRIVAIGEAGLDFHYDNSPRDTQREVFVAQLRLAKELRLPIIVHTREAEAETLEILRAEGLGPEGGVLHCFSGSPELAEEALEMGFYISFSGVITFPKALGLQDVVKAVPIEKILVETDCPYLAPVPVRGKTNEPAFTVHTAQKIAELKGLSLEDVARITTLNTEELFGIAGSAEETETGADADSPGGEKHAKVAYAIRNSLYLNITNRCSNRCHFCAKFSSYTVKGHYLKLAREPDFTEVIAAITELGKEPTEYDEVVFCGFGESLIRIDLVKEVGMYLKRMGCKIRIDTDGLANLYNKRNVLPELKFVDTVSVSLNAPDSETYRELIDTPFGDDAYPAILFFLKEAKKHIAFVIASVVGVPGLDIEACRHIAE
ncbi:MAG: YchF/TatD family DNA exonuclease, partial [Proteobacteria bacterium]|nr:YchF/TatD family DNA exonuclease [Pseudomonadota bacterium]